MGYVAMAEAALGIGAGTFQYFSRNPRGRGVRPMDSEDAKGLVRLAAERGMGPILAHAPYIYNLCSADPHVRDYTKGYIREDLARLELMQGSLYVLHPGSHVGQGADAAIGMIASALDEVLSEGFTTKVLLETMSGKGTEVGGRFGELRAIMDAMTWGGKVGLCLDTCHAYDAGYDMVGMMGAVLSELDDAVGLGRLSAVHVNDSKNGLGCRKDRHERIGEGTMGAAFFGALIAEPAFSGLPMVLETPNDMGGYAREISLLKGMADVGD